MSRTLTLLDALPSLPLPVHRDPDHRRLRRRRGAVLPDRQLPGGEPVDVRRGPAGGHGRLTADLDPGRGDRKSTRLNSSHVAISYAVFCLKKKKKDTTENEASTK